jgi:hypothetical protein
MSESEPVSKEHRDAFVQAGSDLLWLSEHGALGGVACILAERRRQIEKLGWTPERDDRHQDGGLAMTASRCLDEMFGARESGRDEQAADSRLLRSAGALAAAEIDRLSRASERRRRT